MTFLQQEEMLADQIGLRHAVVGPERVLRRQRQREHVVEQRQLLDLRLLERQGQNQEIERSRQQLARKQRGLRLAHAQLQLGKGRMQARQNAGQDIGTDRGDDAEAKRPAQRLGTLAGEIGEILDRLQDRAGAARHLPPRRRQQDALARPLDQGCAERRLELLDLHAERRLGHVAAARRLAEMVRLGQCGEVAELAQSGLHR